MSQTLRRSSKNYIVKGNVTRRKVLVPRSISLPPYALDGRAPPVETAPLARYDLRSKEIQALRKACAIAAEGREYAASFVKPGVTTEEIDEKVTEFFIGNKQVYPSPVNYLGFPKSLCTSVNEVMLHGIPDDRPLEEGDIVSLDVSCYVDGVHGDTCTSVACGNVDSFAENLLNDGKSCFEQSIGLCGPGVPISRIGEFTEKWCIKHGYSVNREFVGHGIGPLFHMKPLVYHCANKQPEIMQPGMVFTIEPIIVEGSAVGEYWDDGWTVTTKDKSWAVQYEHAILITENGYEILTKS